MIAFLWCVNTLSHLILKRNLVSIFLCQSFNIGQGCGLSSTLSSGPTFLINSILNCSYFFSQMTRVMLRYLFVYLGILTILDSLLNQENVLQLLVGEQRQTIEVLQMRYVTYSTSVFRNTRIVEAKHKYFIGNLCKPW